MIYFIIGFTINTVVWLVLKILHKPEKYSILCGMVVSLFLAILGFFATPFLFTESVKGTEEIVSAGGQYFDETKDAAQNDCVWVYIERDGKVEKKMYYGGVNEIKYEGSKASVEYTEYVYRGGSKLKEALFFPTNSVARLMQSAEGVTITLPESEKY